MKLLHLFIIAIAASSFQNLLSGEIFRCQKGVLEVQQTDSRGVKTWAPASYQDRGRSETFGCSRPSDQPFEASLTAPVPARQRGAAAVPARELPPNTAILVVDKAGRVGLKTSAETPGSALVCPCGSGCSICSNAENCEDCCRQTGGRFGALMRVVGTRSKLPDLRTTPGGAAKP